MKRSFTVFGLLAVLAIVLGGCGFFKPALETGDHNEMFKPQASGQVGKTIDDLFTEVAQRIPAFGGMFFDFADGVKSDRRALSRDNSVLYIYLLDMTPQAAAAAERAIVAILGPIFPDLIPPREVRVLKGQYSFLQLREWFDRVGALHPLEEVVMTDIDDVRNRLKIGLMKIEMAERVKQELTKLSIPHEAVEFEETGPLVEDSTLQSYVRPVIGGLQIAYDSSLCTLGFNAIRAGVNGFVTASHCSRTRFGLDSTIYYQPTTSPSTNRIGVENFDPAPFSGSPCPSGRSCRYSDSSFVRYDSGVSFTRGIIAKTTGAFSITIDGSFRITSKGDAVLNQLVDKIGRTTGWSWGNVVGVCIRVDVENTNTTLLCQTLAEYYSEPGDSGSPVFIIPNYPYSNDVKLAGVHRGRFPQDPNKRVFSPISGIQNTRDLGTLTVCAVGFSC